MQTYLRKNNSDELIVLLNGWGMDERPYSPIKSDCDILFLSGYTDLSFDFNLSKYKKFSLITFSAGVFMAGYLKDRLPKFDLKIAVNGILNPYDKESGIPEDSFYEMQNITLENALAFRRKLIPNQKHCELFNKNQPARTLENSMEELSRLKEYFKTPKEFEYDKVIIAKNDKTIPLANQLAAWKGHKNIKIIDGGHFCFYKFETFEEIINF